MSEPVQQESSPRDLLFIVRDIAISAGLGWAAAQAAVSFFSARLSENSDSDQAFLSFIEPIVWITIGGIVFAFLLHLRNKRRHATAHDHDGDRS